MDGHAMPILTRPDGSKLDFASVDELIDYEKKAASSQRSGSRQLPAAPPEARPGSKRTLAAPPEGSKQLAAVPPEAWALFCRDITGAQKAKVRQRKILALLKGSGPAGMTAAELAKPLGESTTIVGRILGGISKLAKKAKMAPEDVIVPRGSDDKTARYKAGPLLLERDIPTP